MKGFIKDKKFHPITVKVSGVRLKRFDQSKIQSLIFNKNKFTISSAKKWATIHDFKANKVDSKENTLRIRQFSPNLIKRGGDCRTIQFGGSGVQGVLCEVPIMRRKSVIVRTQAVRIGNLSKKSNRELANLLDEPLLSDDDFRFISRELRIRNLGDLAIVKREIMKARDDNREPRIPDKFVSKMKGEAKSCWNGITTSEATQNKLIKMTNLPESDYKCGERCFNGWGQLSSEAKRQMTRAMIISDPELRCFKL